MKEKYLHIILTVYAFILYAPIKCVAPRFIDDEQDFETMLTYTQKPIFVTISASWCGVCTSFKDTLNQLTEHEIIKKAVNFICVNFDNAKSLCTKYTVDRIPTFLYIENGKVVRKDVGIKRSVNIKEFFEKTIIETFHLEELEKKVASSKRSPLKSTVAYFVTPPLRYIKDGIEWCIQKLST